MDFYSFTLDRVHPKTRVSVPIDGVSTYLYFVFQYNAAGDFWSLTVSDSEMNMLVSNMPLLSGEGAAANMLRQLGHLGIGSAVIHKLVDAPSSDSPNFENWLREFDLYWGSESA